jgi:hypothetical protein
MLQSRLHHTQHNDTQPNVILHNGTQYNNKNLTLSIMMLSIETLVVMLRLQLIHLY